MKKNIYLLTIIFMLSTTAFADTPNFKKIFKDTDACFILFDLTTNKNVITYNSNRCNERVFACSTFKIPIAIMAFDQKILQDENTVIKWDKGSVAIRKISNEYPYPVIPVGKRGSSRRDANILASTTLRPCNWIPAVPAGMTRKFGLQQPHKINREAFPSWNQDQTPKSWLQNSTVWVSQWIMPQIGMIKIKKYLRLFSYGNQDMSGGITKAWLGYSLKISAYEQMNFLKNLWKGTLPISSHAMALLKKCLPKEITSSGNIFYGKTGAGYIDGGEDPNGRMLGWFVGYVIHDNYQYVFVTNFTDLKSNSTESTATNPGERAKRFTKEILQEMHL